MSHFSADYVFEFAPLEGGAIILLGGGQSGGTTTQVLVYALCQIDSETRLYLNSRDVNIIMDAILGWHIQFLEPKWVNDPWRGVCKWDWSYLPLVCQVRWNPPSRTFKRIGCLLAKSTLGKDGYNNHKDQLSISRQLEWCGKEADMTTRSCKLKLFYLIFQHKGEPAKRVFLADSEWWLTHSLLLPSTSRGMGVRHVSMEKTCPPSSEGKAQWLRKLLLLTNDPETNSSNCKMSSLVLLRKFVNGYLLLKKGTSHKCYGTMLCLQRLSSEAVSIYQPLFLLGSSIHFCPWSLKGEKRVSPREKVRKVSWAPDPAFPCLSPASFTIKCVS